MLFPLLISEANSGQNTYNKGHKVKDGALKTALRPIARSAAVLLPIGVDATMPTLSAVCLEGDEAAKANRDSLLTRLTYQYF